MNNTLYYSLIGFGIFNTYITSRVIFSSQINAFQKAAQSLIIWILPVIGGAIVLYLLNDIDREPPQGPTGGGDGPHIF